VGEPAHHLCSPGAVKCADLRSRVRLRTYADASCFLTLKRSLVRSQYRPPAHVRHPEPVRRDALHGRLDAAPARLLGDHLDTTRTLSPTTRVRSGAVSIVDHASRADAESVLCSHGSGPPDDSTVLPTHRSRIVRPSLRRPCSSRVATTSDGGHRPRASPPHRRRYPAFCTRLHTVCLSFGSEGPWVQIPPPRPGRTGPHKIGNRLRCSNA
jgi:hypothetical protein